MAKSHNPLAKLPFAPTVSAMFAAVAGILVGATPYWLLSRTVAASGLAAILPAFNPPLGDNARIVLMVAAAIVTGIVAFLLALIVERMMRKPKPRVVPRGMTMAPPERAAPPLGGDSRIRPPLFADAELGAPLMSDEAYELARDELILDAPLAEETHPIAIEEETAEFTCDEQAVVSEPTDVMLEEPAEPQAVVLSEPDSILVSNANTLPISALMDRLEQGIASRQQGMPPLRTLARTRAAALLRG